MTRDLASERRALAAVSVVVLLLAGLVLVDRLTQAPGHALGRVPGAIAEETPSPRNVDPYRGLGTWVDVYDYAPTYQEAGTTPPVAPADVDEMAARGVETLYIQAARNDQLAPDGVVDPMVLAQFVVRAHRHDMRVVGWYLPKFADIDLDLRRLAAISDFEVLGHRFDGIAVDIEFTRDVPDHAARNQQLITLSERLREQAGEDVLGAIVLPAVQLEVVNTRLWPGFPYRELADLYDVWMPMSYWTFRRADSGYLDGYRYNIESVDRLRNNLGDTDALVHPIGGIADDATLDQLTAYLRSLVDTDSLGGSVYDWATLGDDSRRLLADGFGSGPAAELAPP